MDCEFGVGYYKQEYILNIRDLMVQIFHTGKKKTYLVHILIVGKLFEGTETEEMIAMESWNEK